MQKEINIEFAKRMLADSIWKEANIEGIPVTYPTTQTIIENGKISGLRASEVVAINNLKYAWAFVLDNLDAETDLTYLKRLNGIVGANLFTGSGDIRDFDVDIGGTSWTPEIPSYDSISDSLSSLRGIRGPAERSLNLFCILSRMQLFPDGNKRTAQLAANKELISTGSGVFSIPVEEKEVFFKLLVTYYETDDRTDLIRFLSDECILSPNLPSKEEFAARRRRQDMELGPAPIPSKYLSNPVNTTKGKQRR